MNIAFIPVRGGSKSIPMKNIQILNGKPLVYWTAYAAQNSNCIDKVIIATDSYEIKSVVNGFCFSKLSVYDREEKNAQDNSSTESVMLEYIEKSSLKDSDNFFLIQATSPMLKSEHIDGMYKKFVEEKPDSMFTGVTQKQFHWTFEGGNKVKPINYDYKNRPRRQDFEGIFAENGACYINTVGNIKRDRCRLSGNIGFYEMPFYTSYEIDEPADWVIVSALMQNYK